MSDAPETEPTDDFDSDDETVAAPRPARRPSSKSPAAAGSSQRLMVAALVVAALTVIGVGGYLWYDHHIWPFSSASSSSSSHSPQETQDAKGKVCKASVEVFRAVARNTHLQNPRPDDPIGSLAVAANARLALSSGGAYLRTRLADEPATPHDLADAVSGLADTLEGLGMSYLAGEPNEAREQMRQDLESRIKTVGKLCE